MLEKNARLRLSLTLLSKEPNFRGEPPHEAGRVARKVKVMRPDCPCASGNTTGVVSETSAPRWTKPLDNEVCLGSARSRMRWHGRPAWPSSVQFLRSVASAGAPVRSSSTRRLAISNRTSQPRNARARRPLKRKFRQATPPIAHFCLDDASSGRKGRGVEAFPGGGAARTCKPRGPL
jgi:hypothetical protein